MLTRVDRLAGEPEETYLERVRSAVEAVSSMVSGLAKSTNGEATREPTVAEWSGWIHRSALAGHLWFATSTACIPLPCGGRRWSWPMWTNHRRLEVATLEPARLNSVELEFRPEIVPPSRGSGLRKDDRALTDVLRLTEMLVPAFAEGAECPRSEAKRWLEAARLLVKKEWWPVLRGSSRSWVSWVEASGGPLDA